MGGFGAGEDGGEIQIYREQTAIGIAFRTACADAWGIAGEDIHPGGAAIGGDIHMKAGFAVVIGSHCGIEMEPDAGCAREIDGGCDQAFVGIGSVVTGRVGIGDHKLPGGAEGIEPAAGVCDGPIGIGDRRLIEDLPACRDDGCVIGVTVEVFREVYLRPGGSGQEQHRCCRGQSATHLFCHHCIIPP